jgi:NADP-dependent 3-hydroxy acid dehydrogenase YdfG
MTHTRLETVGFSVGLQTEFAELSGDWNPIHVNNVAVRRTGRDRLVVHGMHAVLRSLESLAAFSPGLPAPSRFTTRFLKPVYVDDSVDILYVTHHEKELLLRALVDGTVVTEVRVILGDSYSIQQNLESYCIEDRVACREVSLAQMARCSGTTPLAATPETINARFPNTVRWLGIDWVSGLLCVSRLVGMECPGLHSLLSGFTIERSRQRTQPVLEYRVVSLDNRFRRVKMDVAGLGIQGSVEAFVRHPPVIQSQMKELSALVAPGEFAGQRPLIVGGSRGLGEFTAKLLAAGGAHPIITYADGKDDAERVAAEIGQWGGHCDVLKYDIRLPSAQQLELMTTPISTFYYYATCPISRRRTRWFDAKMLEEFLDFYVRGFYELCTILQQRYGPRLSVFYPSSVYVEDRPRGMTEYTMAKAAGEVLCADLNRICPGMQITTVRLPRLLTDQTATFLPTHRADTMDVMLPIIRKFHAARPLLAGSPQQLHQAVVPDRDLSKAQAADDSGSHRYETTDPMG